MTIEALENKILKLKLKRLNADKTKIESLNKQIEAAEQALDDLRRSVSGAV